MYQIYNKVRHFLCILIIFHFGNIYDCLVTAKLRTENQLANTFFYVALITDELHFYITLILAYALQIERS